ncbi:hypothetical protein G6F46_009907 [Rhizopus delemar]|uniref:RraA-like protein n=2 Tax=Rhizopus TaxID=4842 RepID=A0A9P6YW90_9FUNG|nr:hypothetical protein G6F55_010114 [Rhizopus delemar]KAG1536605.1 hypothetical protein G6F51_010874 [Rhizopus arrhizus]KAG1490970.1 hypothetical protein G6F54_010351 [Rhizopus delemar]KAG1509724.1 hypothetical protein G6F53_007223 [Rhizopus delemar]KAG1515438.1 hypothetical protein G6F52_009683 [Rhizopus delemar]
MSLEELKDFSTCEIADALLKLGQRPWGGYVPDIEMWSPAYCEGDTRIVGPAFTVKMVYKEDKTSPTPTDHFNAVWGGLMTARARAKGVQGVVIDGRVRDLNEHREMKFPVFAKSHSILPQNAFVRPSEIQVPITLSSVVLNPGDVIVADVDGVICVPKDKVEQVILNCKKYVEIDKKCMKALQEGQSVKETFATYRD